MGTRYSLDDSHAKIARADEQLRGLHDEIEEFVRRRPYTFHVDRIPILPGKGRKFTASAARIRFSSRDASFLVRFGILAGEVCYLLRSSLNHLVWKPDQEERREDHDEDRVPGLRFCG